MLHVSHIAGKNYTFSSQTQKCCDLVPLFRLSSETAQDNLGLEVLAFTISWLSLNSAEFIVGSQII